MYNRGLSCISRTRNWQNLYCNSQNRKPREKRTHKTGKSYSPLFEGKPFITKIDRIEKTDDNSYQIYDYKTGKPKDSDVICWGGDHEDYFRQLGMYSYIFEHENPGCEITQTGFIFPDGAQRGENHFYMTYEPEDIEKIVNDYKQAISDIYNMKFVPCKEGSKACNYCVFRTTVCKREKTGF